ncbi:MAG: DNA primase [Gammaproteobacteria bacterium]|nr:DNA primase [Gammaproteobacteria bacterium]
MAGSIPRTFIDDLLTRVDIVDIIDARVPLKKAGKDFKACCPFHGEKTPSFTVSRQKQFYYCFGCGAGGSVIRFLMDYERFEFVEAVQELAKLLGLEVPFEGGRPQVRVAAPGSNDLYELMEKVSLYYTTQLRKHSQKEHAVEYLKNRGLTGQTAKQFELGFAPSGWNNLEQAFSNDPEIINQLTRAGMLIKKENGNTYDRFRDRVMFPIRDRRGRVIAFGGRVIDEGTPKYLNSPETDIFHKGDELYGLHHALKQPGAVASMLVVEGYMDVVSLSNRGVNNAVATLGTAISQSHVQVLVKHTSEIIYCFDGDAAGRKAAWRALEASLPSLKDGQQFKFMFLPEGEDPDTMVTQLGQQGFTQLQNQAKPLSDFMIDYFLEKADHQTVDGQARLIELAKPLMSQLPQGAYAQLLTARLAERIDMPENELFGRFFSDSRSSGRKFRANNVAKAEKPSVIKLAIAMLLESPSLAQSVSSVEVLQELHMPGVDLLEKMLVFIASHPNITTGALLEHWHGTREGDFLYETLRWEHHVPEQGVESEFKGVVDILFRELRNQRLAKLLSQSKFAPLSADEKTELARLLAE